MAAEPGLAGRHILAPAVGEGRGCGRPSGCLCHSCLRVLEVPVISCVPVIPQRTRPVQLLSAGEGGTAWGGPGLVQREMLSGEHPCPTAAGLLTPGTRFVACGAAPATDIEWLSGCPWFSSRVKVRRQGRRGQLVSSGSTSHRQSRAWVF